MWPPRCCHPAPNHLHDTIESIGESWKGCLLTCALPYFGEALLATCNSITRSDQPRTTASLNVTASRRAAQPIPSSRILSSAAIRFGLLFQPEARLSPANPLPQIALQPQAGRERASERTWATKRCSTSLPRDAGRNARRPLSPIGRKS